MRYIFHLPFASMQYEHCVQFCTVQYQYFVVPYHVFYVFYIYIYILSYFRYVNQWCIWFEGWFSSPESIQPLLQYFTQKCLLLYHFCSWIETAAKMCVLSSLRNLPCIYNLYISIPGLLVQLGIKLTRCELIEDIM